MQDHRFEFVVHGTPEEVWDVMPAPSRTDVDAGEGTTRVCFRETHAARNPVSRLLEKPVHTFISKDNDRLIEAALVRALAEVGADRERNQAP